MFQLFIFYRIEVGSFPPQYSMMSTQDWNMALITQGSERDLKLLYQSSKLKKRILLENERWHLSILGFCFSLSLSYLN